MNKIPKINNKVLPIMEEGKTKYCLIKESNQLYALAENVDNPNVNVPIMNGILLTKV